jgi:regulator of Ty1 transposition protein 103
MVQNCVGTLNLELKIFVHAATTAKTMSFSESSLNKKFFELNSTQQSVQTLSLWLIHHRKHSHTIVKIWLKELINTSKSDRKLTFIYLANDILQNSRKKGNEYMNEFAEPLNDAIENTAKYSDDKIRFVFRTD